MSVAFRNAMAQRAAGVAVVAVEGASCGRAVTVTSLASISLSPALVGFCLAAHGTTAALLGIDATVGITLLSARQQPLAEKYARRERGPIDFARETDARRWSDAWVFDGASAWLAGTVRQIVPLGDHRLVVVEIGAARDFPGDALVYHDRRFGRFRAIG